MFLSVAETALPLLSVMHGQCDALTMVTFPAYDGTLVPPHRGMARPKLKLVAH